MLEIAIDLMFQDAQVYWPSLTSDMFREVGLAVSLRLDRGVTVEQMEKLLREELLARPVIPFPTGS